MLWGAFLFKPFYVPTSPCISLALLFSNFIDVLLWIIWASLHHTKCWLVSNFFSACDTTGREIGQCSLITKPMKALFVLIKQCKGKSRIEQTKVLAAISGSILLPFFVNIFKPPFLLNGWPFYLAVAVQLYSGYYILRFIIRNADWWAMFFSVSGVTGRGIANAHNNLCMKQSPWKVH